MSPRVLGEMPPEVTLPREGLRGWLLLRLARLLSAIDAHIGDVARAAVACKHEPYVHETHGTFFVTSLDTRVKTVGQGSRALDISETVYGHALCKLCGATFLYRLP